MGQAAISGVPPGLTFGGLALPNGQGTMTAVNLNDLVNWFWMDWPGGSSDSDFMHHVVGQFAWRARGAFVGQDAYPRVLKLRMRYREINTPLGAALAKLSQGGLQNLTFDSGSTVLPCKYAAVRNRQVIARYPPYYWEMNLEFLAPTPWFNDASATNLTTVNIVTAPTTAPSGAVTTGGALATGTYTLQYTYVTASGETAASPASSNIVLTTGNQQINVSAVTPLPPFATAVKWYFASGPTTGFTVQNSGGAFTLNTAGNGTPAPTSTPATAFSVAYAGSVFAEPSFVFNVPSSSTGVIGSATLTNTMSGEALTVLFPGGLTASTLWAITMDCGAFTARDASGKSYDVTGSFPNLYGPAGQSNTFTVAQTALSGRPSGLTLTGSWNPRWEI